MANVERPEDFENVACEGAVGGENVGETDENEILDRLVNRVKIKGGIDIDQLRRDGAIFEIDEEAVAATNEEFKEEFAAAQQTSYGAALGKAYANDTGGSFLKDLGYDGLGGYGLGLQEDGDSDMDGQEPFEALSKKMTNLTEDGGVKKRVKRVGGGESVMDGAEVHIHYNGYLEHSDEPFDSTRLRNKKQIIQLGKGQLIPGLEIGVKSMKKNEFAYFLISHEYAYGDMGCPPRVPSKAQVLFEVELLHFHDEEKIVEFDNLPPEEMAKYSRVYPAAEERLKEGKVHYSAEKYRAALKSFRYAASDLEKCNLESEEEEKNQQKLLLTLYKNISVTAMKLKDYHKAIKYGTKALSCPKSVMSASDLAKCNYLCGKANRVIGELKMSQMYLEKAFKYKPNDKQIQEELENLDNAIEKYKADERLMAQRMIVPKEEQRPLPDPELCPWLKEPQTMVIYLKQLESYFEDETNLIFRVPKDRINSNKDILMWEEAANRLNLEILEKPSENNRKMRIKRRDAEQ